MLDHKFVCGVRKASRDISDCMPDSHNLREEHESVNHRDLNEREQVSSYLEIP
jgi:hypothetical protein